jgi:hypothetical protein
MRHDYGKSMVGFGIGMKERSKFGLACVASCQASPYI